MKHKGKKKGHGHSKHHKHKSSTSTSLDGDGAHPRSSPSPRSSNVSMGNAPTDASRRGSMCEYCGATSSSPDGYDDDSFDCADDCERFSVININAVTCSTAYQLRSPDLTAFYCQSGAVLSEIHGFIRQSTTSDNSRSAFTESAVLNIRPKLLALFATMWRLSVGAVGPGVAPNSSLPASSSSSSPHFDQEDDSEEGGNKPPRGPTCPFVMTLSVLLPALHKLLHWTHHTKPQWWLGNSASFSASAALDLLATQLQFHDLLAQVAAEGDCLVQVIEENEERDQDVTRLAQHQPPPTPRRSGGYSSSSSSSSLASSASRPGSATDRDNAWRRLPQVRRISFEFEEWLAECKFELAELSEAMQENIEITALRLSRFPPNGITGEGANAVPMKPKGTASEFVELLMKLVLVPLGERVVVTPSASRSYIFPRLVDRCIGVAIDEYVAGNAKWTTESSSQFEKASELFRSWGLGVDAEYDKQLINAPRDVARLGLSSMDAFRRLDIVLQTWVRQGREGEAYVPRLTFKTNLENLRSTLKKTMTARSGGNGGAVGAHISGLATPPPVQ